MAAHKRIPAGVARVKALKSCALCHGLGHSPKRGVICPCVYRNVFRICLERYHLLVDSDAEGRDCFIEQTQGHFVATMESSEYVADFDLAARRALSPAEGKILRWYFLDGQQWRPCALRLQMDRGTFFHAVYRTMEHLGAELSRSQIWPLDQYFGARRVIVPMRTAAFGGADEVPNFHRQALMAA